MGQLYSSSSARAFLKKTFEALKEGNPNLSTEKFAEQIRVGHSTLKMVLTGKRQLTVHQALSIARELKLSPDETAYLERLTLKDSAKTAWENAYYARSLSKIRQNARVQTRETAEKILLAEPYAMPFLVYLLESGCAVLEEVSPDLTALAIKFGCTKKQLTILIEKLTTTKLLERSVDGKFHIRFDRMSHKLHQKTYLKGLLNKAAEQIDNDYENPEKMFVGYTFTATDENLLKLNMELKSLMERFMELPSNDKEIQIAQACFQVFPVVRI